MISREAHCHKHRCPTVRSITRSQIKRLEQYRQTTDRLPLTHRFHIRQCADATCTCTAAHIAAWVPLSPARGLRQCCSYSPHHTLPTIVSLSRFSVPDASTHMAQRKERVLWLSWITLSVIGKFSEGVLSKMWEAFGVRAG